MTAPSSATDARDHVHDGLSIFGFVKDTAGKAIRDARVTADIKGLGSVIARTDATGVYKFPGFGKGINQNQVSIIIVETIDANPEIAAQTLKLFFEPERNVLPQQAEINVKGLAQVIAFMGEAGTVKQPLPRRRTLRRSPISATSRDQVARGSRSKRHCL